MKRHRLLRGGFTLVEVMIAVTILAVASGGLIAAFTGCFTVNEGARNSTIAINGAQKKMEEIRNYDFDDIYSDYNGATFEVAGLHEEGSENKEGSIVVDNTNSNLLKVTVTVCWKQKDGRIFGEDSDLDGILDAGEGEDSNENGKLDSPVQLVTWMANREGEE